ncbi:unnamed protein product, partial [Polarella glacialis]
RKRFRELRGSKMTRVVLFAQDDTAAAACLGPLAARNCRVLAFGAGEATSIFARRCVELGFGFANALEEDVVNGALASFKADLTVCVPDISGKLPKALESAGTGKYIIRAR